MRRLLLLGLMGCGGGEVVRQGLEMLVESRPAVTSAPVDTTCDAVAERICWLTPIDCEAAKGLVAGAELEVCVEALGALAPAEGIHPEARGSFALSQLLDMPTFTPAQREVLRNYARGTGDFLCPGVSVRHETETETWCETRDAVRHGPLETRSAERELVRTVHYDAGKIVTVDVPASWSGLDPELFVCADGQRMATTRRGSATERTCTTATGDFRSRTLWLRNRMVGIESFDEFAAMTRP